MFRGVSLEDFVSHGRSPAHPGARDAGSAASGLHRPFLIAARAAGAESVTPNAASLNVFSPILSFAWGDAMEIRRYRDFSSNGACV